MSGLTSSPDRTKTDFHDRAMASFAESYADQNERDYALFKKAVKAGRVQATTGL